jgi:hypothetical protein
MGTALSTAGLVTIGTVLLIIMAVLIWLADDRLRNATNFASDQNFQWAIQKIVPAQILAWISAGLGLLLVIGYFILHSGLIDNEWVHLILWIGIFGTLIASGILVAIALGDIDRSTSDDNGASGYLWGAVGVGIAAFVILLISGGWRIATITTQPKKKKLYVAHRAAPAGPGEVPATHTVRVTSTEGTTTRVGVPGGQYTTTTTTQEGLPQL